MSFNTYTRAEPSLPYAPLLGKLNNTFGTPSQSRHIFFQESIALTEVVNFVDVILVANTCNGSIMLLGTINSYLCKFLKAY